MLKRALQEAVKQSGMAIRLKLHKKNQELNPKPAPIEMAEERSEEKEADELSDSDLEQLKELLA
jgi:uncharacterized membrane protein